MPGFLPQTSVSSGEYLSLHSEPFELQSVPTPATVPEDWASIWHSIPPSNVKTSKLAIGMSCLAPRDIKGVRKSKDEADELHEWKKKVNTYTYISSIAIPTFIHWQVNHSPSPHVHKGWESSKVCVRIHAIAIIFTLIYVQPQQKCGYNRNIESNRTLILTMGMRWPVWRCSVHVLYRTGYGGVNCDL